VLQTGRTEFKEPVPFKRHISTLAKYVAKHHLLAHGTVEGEAGLVVVTIQSATLCSMLGWAAVLFKPQCVQP